MSQIIAAIIVLSMSRHEHPQTPLFAWIIGYTAGCIATLPHLYWRYIHHNSLSFEQGPAHSNQGNTRNSPLGSGVFADYTVTQDPEQENGHNLVLETWKTIVTSCRRYSMKSIVDHFKMALDRLLLVMCGLLLEMLYGFSAGNLVLMMPLILHIYVSCSLHSAVLVMFENLSFYVPLSVAASLALYQSWASERICSTVEVLPQNQLMHCQHTSSKQRGETIAGTEK
ncbi:hypothetical protein B296_00057826 [Ensete ventricosum]|uniref:Uncharacterized protein n=1 Tax=Ensete ventricosum TaxID=4639 RepID=A0A426WZ26_ENSVE|nr:hypothetical protein B296_00057826 [Ensete ventricosum]